MKSTFILIAFVLSSIATSPCHSKVKPSKFDDLISSSDLIVLVDVIAIDSLPKNNQNNPTGSATVKVTQVISGKAKKDQLLEIHWKTSKNKASFIYTLGEWLLFLKTTGTTDAVYGPAYGARSFWPIQYGAQGGQQECQKNTVLRYPVKHLEFPKGLIQKTPVYLDSLPPEKNPIELEALCIEKVIKYINN